MKSGTQAQSHLILWHVMVMGADRAEAEARIAACVAPLTLDGPAEPPELYRKFDGWWESWARRAITASPEAITAFVKAEADKLGTGWIFDGPGFNEDGSVDVFDAIFDGRQAGRPTQPFFIWGHVSVMLSA